MLQYTWLELDRSLACGQMQKWCTNDEKLRSPNDRIFIRVNRSQSNKAIGHYFTVSFSLFLQMVSTACVYAIPSGAQLNLTVFRAQLLSWDKCKSECMKKWTFNLETDYSLNSIHECSENESSTLTGIRILQPYKADTVCDAI